LRGEKDKKRSLFELFSKNIRAPCKAQLARPISVSQAQTLCKMGLHAAQSIAYMTIKLDLDVTLKPIKESLVGLGGAQQTDGDGHWSNVPVHCP